MLDSAYRVIQQHDRLTVAVPPASLFASWVGIGVFLILWLSIFFTLHSVKRMNEKFRRNPLTYRSQDGGKSLRLGYTIGAIVSIGAPLLFLALGYTSGSIVLDRTANRASMTSKMVLFLPSITRSVDLNAVTDARLDQKPNSRRIRLEVSHGRDLAYPMWSDRAGQEEAVNAMNQFLGVH
jgi:hypothetical protein